MTQVISAALVKELREMTGAGMMECKKALTETGGDIEKAVDVLRTSGAAKAGKKAGRIAAEGVVSIIDNGKQAAMIEINSETDFVARDDNFTKYVNAVTQTVLEKQKSDIAELGQQIIHGDSITVEEARANLVGKVGENIQPRRAVISNPASASVGSYLHGNRIGVIVELNVDNKPLANDLAMHIAASNPLVISPSDVSEDLIAREKDIYMAQAAASGKPQEIIEKMVVGRMKKYLDEVSLMGQPFVKDPDTSVGALLQKSNAKVIAFHRYEVGEGIEKIVEDFKEAVMSQIQGG
ncbi:MAG: translation elongation factor Ts [Gammaproteobacteria bacterium]